MDPRVLCGNRWLGLDISGGLSCPLCIDLAFGGGGGGVLRQTICGTYSLSFAIDQAHLDVRVELAGGSHLTCHIFPACCMMV